MLQIVCEAWTHFDSKNKIQASKSILKLAKITYIVLLTMMQIFHQQEIHRLWLPKNEHPSWQQCKISSLQSPDTRLHNTKVIYCVPAKIFSIGANSFLFHENVNFVMMSTCNFSHLTGLLNSFLPPNPYDPPGRPNGLRRHLRSRVPLNSISWKFFARPFHRPDTKRWPTVRLTWIYHPQIGGAYISRLRTPNFNFLVCVESSSE